MEAIFNASLNTHQCCTGLHLESQQERAFVPSQGGGKYKQYTGCMVRTKKNNAQAKKSTFFQSLALIYIPPEEKVTQRIKLMEIFQAVQGT